MNSLILLLGLVACGEKETQDTAVNSTSDADGDGFTMADGDCDDNNNTIYPDADDTWYDGVDSNCAGDDDFDQDGDGFAAVEYEAESSLPGGDCWDDPNQTPADFMPLDGFPALSAADVHPDAEDAPYDAVDQDCAGSQFEFDADQDGDDSAYYADGNGQVGGDCVDNAADADLTETGDFAPNEINSNETETYYDGVDQNCDGANDYDQDGDGYEALQYGGDDCDDLMAEVNVGAVEIPADGIDQDCNNAELCYQDGDFDGYGSAVLVESSDLSCSVAGVSAEGSQDCNDSSNVIYPNAPETISNPADENCDGMETAGHMVCEGGSVENSVGEEVYFLACEEAQTQADARSICTTFGYDDLASLRDDTEATFATDFFPWFLDYWIGYTDQTSEGSFYWLDGYTGGYTSWENNQPAGGLANNCVFTNGDNQWATDACTSTNYFICQSR